MELKLVLEASEAPMDVKQVEEGTELTEETGPLCKHAEEERVLTGQRSGRKSRRGDESLPFFPLLLLLSVSNTNGFMADVFGCLQ